jgi:hypothetical protein
MAKDIILSPEVLRQLLRYEPDTGKLFWLHRGPEWFIDGRYSAKASCEKWNNQYAGKEAFCTLKDGYFSGEVMRKHAFAHRVAWAVYYGFWPDQFIDHIDGNRKNNKIANLRNATKAQNCQNRGASKASVSGLCGVSASRRKKNGWAAYIFREGKNVFLGNFSCKHDAAMAYDAAAIALHGQFARTNFPVET